MNHIHRLQNDLAAANARCQRLEDSLIELQAYLASPKFHTEDWVSAREMYFRVQQIRWESTDVNGV